MQYSAPVNGCMRQLAAAAAAAACGFRCASAVEEGMGLKAECNTPSGEI